MSFVGERACVTVDMAAKQATIGDYYRGGIPRNSHGGYITFVAIIANCVRLVGVNQTPANESCQKLEPLWR